MNRITQSLLLGLGLLGLAVTSAHAQTRPSLAALQAQIATLQSQVASGTIPGVSGFATMDTTTDPSRPRLLLSGANLQVVNGAGSTPTVNGVGNVIIGYDEARTAAAVCSLGGYPSQAICTTNGGTWASSFKSGSHNLVVGRQNAYSRYGGIVAGEEHVISGPAASVLGGYLNTASNQYSSVTGGNSNTASGDTGSVSGGFANFATGRWSSVSGGSNNVASYDSSSVNGGDGNLASGLHSSVAGGEGCSTGTTSAWVVGTQPGAGCSTTLHN